MPGHGSLEGQAGLPKAQKAQKAQKARLFLVSSDLQGPVWASSTPSILLVKLRPWRRTSLQAVFLRGWTVGHAALGWYHMVVT